MITIVGEVYIQGRWGPIVPKCRVYLYTTLVALSRAQFSSAKAAVVKLLLSNKQTSSHVVARTLDWHLTAFMLIWNSPV